MEFDVLGFFRAVLGDSISLMSGIVSIGLTIWGFSKNKEQQRKMFGIASAAVFIIACVRVWSIEHEKVEAAHPKLSLSVVDAAMVPVPQQRFEIGQAVVYVGMNINNTGAPTSLYNWDFTVQDEAGNKFGSTPIQVQDGMTLHFVGEGRDRRLALTNDLSGLDQPITMGQRIGGYVMAVVSGISDTDASRFKGRITVTAKDAWEKIHTVETSISPNHISELYIVPVAPYRKIKPPSQ